MENNEELPKLLRNDYGEAQKTEQTPELEEDLGVENEEVETEEEEKVEEIEEEKLTQKEIDAKALEIAKREYEKEHKPEETKKERVEKMLEETIDEGEEYGLVWEKEKEVDTSTPLEELRQEKKAETPMDTYLKHHYTDSEANFIRTYAEKEGRSLKSALEDDDVQQAIRNRRWEKVKEIPKRESKAPIYLLPKSEFDALEK